MLRHIVRTPTGFGKTLQWKYNQVLRVFVIFEKEDDRHKLKENTNNRDEEEKIHLEGQYGNATTFKVKK